MNRIYPILLLIFVILAHVLPVSAHGYVIRAIPEDRAVLERAPARIQYWFSEGLEPQFSEINLRDQSGAILATGAVDAEDDGLLSLRVPSNLADGAYIVELRPAFASDGHVVAESRVFFVGEEVGEIVGQGASDQALPFEIVWKVLLFHATYLLFGVTILYTSVLVPVWGSNRYPMGLLPPRLMRRLNYLFWFGLVAAFAANGLALIQQTMVFFGIGFGQVFDGDFMTIVRTGSRFGDVWTMRMGILIVITALHAASLRFGDQFPKVVRSFWTANTWALALLIGVQAVNSHAAGSLVWAWVAVFIHWLHTLGVALWVGGIMALVFILPVALKPYHGEERWQALRPLMTRFSRYVVAAVLLVLTTGFYNATNWFLEPAGLQTTYGAALAYKVVMVGLLLIVGGLHHVALRPRLIERLPFKGAFEWARSFSSSMHLEAMLVIGAIMLTGLLSATPTPEPTFLQREIETPSAAQTVDDLTVQMSIAPGGTGVNTYDVRLMADDGSLIDQTVRVQFVAPDRDKRYRAQTAEAVGDGLYVLAGDEIDEIGRWWALVDVVDASGEQLRFAFEWEISDDAAVIQSLRPTIMGFIAGISVLLALGYALYPLGRWSAAQMEWTRTNVVVAGGLILMTIITLGVSIVVFNRQQAALEARRNPPPQRINPTLPDQDSLSTGAAAFEQGCSAWLAHDDFPVLIGQIGLMRAEAIYQSIETGWRDLPSCDSELSEVEQWDIVNYLHSLSDT